MLDKLNSVKDNLFDPFKLYTLRELEALKKEFDALLKTQEGRIANLQDLKQKEQSEKSRVNLDRVKFVMSLEVFNHCLELVLKNPVLVKAIVGADERQAVLILQCVMGFSPQQAEKKHQMLLQIVRGLKQRARASV